MQSGRTVAAAFLLQATLLVGCASTAPPPAASASESTNSASVAASSGKGEVAKTSESESEAPAFCDLVCERARVIKRAQDDPDYHAQATENANAVLGAMHPDLLACYKKRIAVNPAAHGFITVDIVIGPDGRVMKVETTGGAILGEATMGCLVHRIEKGTFAPPHGGGTLRIQVPFSLRRLAPGEDA